MSVGIRLKTNHTTRKKIIVLLNKATNILMKEKRVPLIKLMYELGYMSPEYFKRSVLKMLMMLSDCIATEDEYVVWICSDEDDEVSGGG